MKKGFRNTILGIIFIVLLVGVIAYYNGNSFAVTSSSQVIKLGIPVDASYKCEPIGNKYGITVQIPKDGSTITKDNVGFYTNGITNINLKFFNSFWSTDYSTRVGYALCDSVGNNCAGYTYKTNTFGAGTFNIPVSSVDFNKSSLRLIYQRIPFYLVGGWQNSEGLSISFDGLSFGLRLYSSSNDPAGKIVCSTSCNINCPDVGVRKYFNINSATDLGFYQSAPYFEYWNTIDYDLNKQGGATVYNGATGKFCFAGAIYSSKSITLLDGTRYIYPDTNTRENKLCCPGATIQSTYSDQVCQNDYTFKTIQDTDKLTCVSDYNCPGLGNNVCQNKLLAGYHCQNKDSNNIGLCVKSSGTSVSCCLDSDCSSDQSCDVSSHTCKGGTTLPVCGDGKISQGEACDNGASNGKDSMCTADCKLVGDYCDRNPTDKTCTDVCSNVAWYNIAGKINCALSGLGQLFTIVKWLLLIIASVFSLFYSKDFVLKLLGKTKENKIASWVIGILIGGAVGVICFILLLTVLFWWIVIGSILFGIVIKLVVPRF